MRCSRWITSYGLGVVVATWALAACGGSVTARTSAPTSLPTPVHDRSAAAAWARTLLARSVLPPGSQRVSSAPVAVLDRAPQESATPDLAQATRFAEIDRTVGQVRTWLTGHRPQGCARPCQVGSGSSGGAPSEREDWVEYGFRDLPAGVDQAEVLVSVAAGAGGRSDLRVDAQVTWLPPKPEGTTVPSGDTVALVSIREADVADEQSGLVPRPERVLVSQAGVFDRLRAAADGLPAREPGRWSCPADLGTRHVVAFAPSWSHRPNITYIAGSCNDVTVTRGGRVVAVLDNDAAFTDAYTSVLDTTR